MEQVIPRPQSPPQARSLALHLPRYLLAMLLLLLACTGVTLSVWGLGHSPQLPPNPFISFADVFPGQPRSAVVSRGFSCLTSAYSGYSESPNEICSLWPKDGLFSQVSVGINQDIVQNILFTLHENTLRIGDLMLLWGQQDFHMYNGAGYFFWGNTHNTTSAVNHTRRFSHFLSVRKVYIQNGDTLSGPDR